MKWGTFVDVESGKQVEEPEIDKPCPILCGAWPNEHAGCVQRMCSCCTDPVGISPKGLALHDASPGTRPLLCKFCYSLLALLTARDEADGLAFLDALRKGEPPDGH